MPSNDPETEADTREIDPADLEHMTPYLGRVAALPPSNFETTQYPDHLWSAPTRAYYGPPGTGKTHQLKQDVDRELDNGVSPRSICATSYRVEMAEALAEAVAERTGSDSDWLATTHSISWKLMRESDDYGNDLEVVDGDTKATFCESLGLPYHSPEKSELDPGSMYSRGVTNVPSGQGGSLRDNDEYAADVYFDTLSILKNVGAPFTSWEMYTPFNDDELTQVFGKWYPTGEDFRAFDRLWQAYKDAEGLVDFEDMLFAAASGLAPPVDVLIEDEFQDKTPLQVAVHNQWSRRADRVYVAGDPSQAIYGFMGTTPEFMREALDNADEAVTLEKSYRNAPEVTALGRRILSWADEEVPKVEGTGDGSAVRIGMDEYQHLVGERDDKKTFHLFRTNRGKGSATSVLSDMGVPFVSQTGSRWTDKQANFFNGVARIAEEARREVPFGERRDYSSLSYLERQRVAEAISGTHWIVPKGEYPGFVETVDEIDEVLDMRGLIPHFQRSNPLRSLIDRDGPFNVSSFSDPVAERLVSTWDARNGRPVESFEHHVNTIHASKGREAHTVFLFDSTSKNAQWKPTDPHADDEELRVWYVGVTRAEHDCFIVDTPSKYKQELPI